MEKMNELSTLPKLAICLYGDNDTHLHLVKQNCSLIYGSRYNITFFYNFDSNERFKNLFSSVFEKRKVEISTSLEFDVCLALNISHNSRIYEYISSIELLTILVDSEQLMNIDCNILYYTLGYVSPRNLTTVAHADAFFASSMIFDLASNYGIAYTNLPSNRNSPTSDQDFYYFLKSLKIKTKCINYENSSLFKRAT